MPRNLRNAQQLSVPSSDESKGNKIESYSKNLGTSSFLLLWSPAFLRFQYSTQFFFQLSNRQFRKSKDAFHIAYHAKSNRNLFFSNPKPLYPLTILYYYCLTPFASQPGSPRDRFLADLVHPVVMACSFHVHCPPKAKVKQNPTQTPLQRIPPRPGAPCLGSWQWPNSCQDLPDDRFGEQATHQG